MNRSHLALITASILLSGPTIAGSDHVPQAYEGSAEFKAIKKLQGHWEGTGDQKNEKGIPLLVRADYKVSSGGRAVIETLFAGSPHEMVSVYFDEGGKLAMTHYCLLPNQPHMTLKNATPDEIVLAVGNNGNVDPMSDHMDAVTLSIPAADNLIETWQSVEGGKPGKTVVITLTKKSS